MERVHKTNLKTIKYPIVDLRKGFQKRYRGTEYRIDRTRTKVSYRRGSYRGVEHLLRSYN